MGPVRIGAVESGLVWIGLVRTSPIRSGQVRTGPVRSGPVLTGPVRSGPDRSRLDWPGQDPGSKIVLVKSNSLGDCSVFQAMLFTDFYVCFFFASSLKQQVKYGLKQTCAHRHVPEHGIVPREYLDA